MWSVGGGPLPGLAPLSLGEDTGNCVVFLSMAGSLDSGAKPIKISFLV